jgi:DNA mismatch endonuclease (patch repair protein)
MTTDVFDSKKRSEVMSRILGRGNKSTELAMVLVFKGARITGWRRHMELRPSLTPWDIGRNRARGSGRLRVRPDFVFRQERVALFVDGCFWHGCPVHSTKPRQNSEFWEMKLRANQERDRRQTRALKAAGWTVLRYWEHELREPASLSRRIVRALDRTRASPGSRKLPARGK